MAIVDGRTSLDTWETNQPDDLTGAAGGTADTEIFIQGSQSYGFYSGSSRDGLLYDAGTAQNWANNTFYIWVNCGVVGLLNTRAAGGLAIRFCGATVSDWFEFYIAGSDDWPPSVQGGWTMFVVDIEAAKTASDATNGTPPATSAIRYVGISTQTPTMPRMVDNTWLDAMWRLPASTAGIRVEGQNTGSVDWTWADIVSTAEAAAWGTAKTAAGGAVAINTPVQFGANDAVTHGFSDTGVNVLWEDWDVATSFYGLTVIGGSGTQSFQLGAKTGTGNDATGSLGGSISAISTGDRWFLDADDANIDVCNLYGVQFQHGGDFQLDNANVETISCNFVDCSSARVDNSLFLRNIVIDANTADGVAFLTTDDISDVRFSTFEFSDGHAIELTTPRVASQTSTSNVFTGYGADTTNDAALYNNSGGLVTIDVTGASITVRDGTSASTVLNLNPVTTEVTVTDNTGALLQDARVIVEAADGTGDLPFDDTVTITRVSSTASVAHTAHGLVNGDKVVIRGAEQTEYNGVFAISNVTTNAYDYTLLSGTPTTPATGTIKSTGVVLEGLTSALGVISAVRSFTVDQPITGFVRKSTSSPYFQSFRLSGTVDSANGFFVTVRMVLDE